MKVVIAIILFFHITAFGQNLSQPILEQIKHILPNNAQIAIACVDSNQTIYYGFKKENDFVQPIENQHALFEIGSLTKVFTSTLLSILVDQKKLNREDLLHKTIGQKLHSKPQITLQQLSNHTSGLPRLPSNIMNAQFNPADVYGNYGEIDLLTYLKNDLQLLSKPGESYAYSNLGAGILGFALAKSQKTTFASLLTAQILQPLGMNNTFPSNALCTKERVKSRDENGNLIGNWNFDVLAPAGSMVSNLSDMALFATKHFEGKNPAYQATHISTYTVDAMLEMGLGWHLLKQKNGEVISWHNGATAGYQSSMAIDTKQKKAIIILSNIPTSHAQTDEIDLLCLKLIQGKQ